MPSRGEVFELRSARRVRGHEQRGRRFAVVLQSSDLGTLSTSVVAPTSLSAQPSVLRPEVELLGRTTRVLLDQLGAVDLERLGKRRGRLTAGEMGQVATALGLLLGLH
ncbi:MAG: type II toxin-antitoxin system PemK/MazF family toxin [Solirubrobacterales bacterium]